MKRIVDEKLIDYLKKRPCVACGSSHLTTTHHIKSKGSGGHDISENLIPLCIHDHTLWHIKGTNWMATRYPSIKQWLEDNNWEYCFFRNKYINYELY